MGYMTTVSPVSKFGGVAEFFTGIREDGTYMVFTFDELVDVVEHDVLCLLLCGDTLEANLPEHIGQTNEEYVALNPAAPETEWWTDEQIGEQRMLHGLD